MSQHSSEAGYSIVELLITLLIIGIVFGAFTVTFTTIQTINKKATDVTTANSIAFAKLQDYENLPYGSLASTTPTGTLQQVEDFSSSLPKSLQAPRVGKVYINTFSGGRLKQVVVNVTFGSGGDQRQIQYGDFIQTNGLGH